MRGHVVVNGRGIEFESMPYICVGRLVLRERGSILGSGTSGDIVHTKNCGRRFDRKAMMHGPCILIYPGPHGICYSTQN